MRRTEKGAAGGTGQEGTPFWLSVGLETPSLRVFPSESHAFRWIYGLYVFKMSVTHVFSVTLTYWNLLNFISVV